MTIREDILKATSIEAKRNEDEQALRTRLVVAVSELPDAGWDSISEPAQDWYNAAATALSAKSELPDFPDEPEVAATLPARAHQSRPAAEPAGEAKPNTGERVSVLTKRGKTYEGKLVEWDATILVIETDAGEELEFAPANIDSVRQTDTPVSTSKPAEAEQANFDIFANGDMLEVTTKRGKVVSGKVVEVDDTIVVLLVGKEELEFDRVNITWKHVVETKNKETKKPAPTTKAETKPAAKATPAPAEKVMPATQAMREAIVDNMDADKATIAKILEKQGLQFRSTTLDLIYADAQKVISIIKDRGLLK